MQRRRSSRSPCKRRLALQRERQSAHDEHGRWPTSTAQAPTLAASERLQSRAGGGEGRKEDAEYLAHIAQNIQGRTICAFGEAAAWPVLSFVKKFRDEFEAQGAADEANQGAAASRKIAASPGS